MENKVQSRWNGLVILAISAIVGAISGYGFAAGYKKSPLLTVLIASGAFAIFFLYRFWKVTSKLKNVRDEEESIRGHSPEINFILLGSISLIYILHIGKYMYELHKRMIY